MRKLKYAKKQLRHFVRPIRHALRPIREKIHPVRDHLLAAVAIMSVLGFMPVLASAQPATPVVLAGAELSRVVPSGFYFQGQSAPTQIRNSAATRVGDKRYVVAGLVDTSGYAADIRAKYVGFLISDSPISINGSPLAVGAYGFGYGDGKFNVLDLAGNEVLSVSITKDSALRRPRPLMMVKDGNRVRLYGGRDYVVIEFQ